MSSIRVSRCFSAKDKTGICTDTNSVVCIQSRNFSEYFLITSRCTPDTARWTLLDLLIAIHFTPQLHLHSKVKKKLTGDEYAQKVTKPGGQYIHQHPMTEDLQPESVNLYYLNARAVGLFRVLL